MTKYTPEQEAYLWVIFNSMLNKLKEKKIKRDRLEFARNIKIE